MLICELILGQTLAGGYNEEIQRWALGELQGGIHSLWWLSYISKDVRIGND